ncbi:ABC transporter ATP-binding protein [Dankookia sp. GCM10030260]|uniref:ABC transporter ATP-binding protein n=1 Tax=Dankookia sp. GCM10030260 TaxID=3273390 RepID=UPI00361C491F
MSSELPAIELQGVGKAYRQYRHPHQRLLQALLGGRRRFFSEAVVLRDVTFSARRGETVGIVGRNGAGKSTLLQLIAGTLQPSFGTVRTRGRIAPLIELGSGFNPELTGRENVFFNGMLLGMTEPEIAAKFDAIAGFADIGDYLEQPVKIYSSGMYARLAFAVAIHVEPDILIVDEILSVGDAAFQRKSMRRFYDIRDQGCTILMVAHDEYLVRSICQRCLYLSQGRMVAFGAAAEVVTLYMSDLLPPDPVEPAPAEDTPASAMPPPVAVETAPEAPTAATCRIESVGLLDDAGRTIEVVPHGSTITVEFRCRWHGEDIPPQVSFVFNLYSVTGTYVCGSTTLMDGLGAQAAGQTTLVRITFPDLQLLAGRYHWRVAVNDAEGLLVLAEAKAACPFRVTDEYRSAGVVHLERRWDFSPQG